MGHHTVSSLHNPQLLYSSLSLSRPPAKILVLVRAYFPPAPMKWKEAKENPTSVPTGIVLNERQPYVKGPYCPSTAFSSQTSFHTFHLFLESPTPPPSTSLSADDLVFYVIEKIETIRRDFLQVPPPLFPSTLSQTLPTVPLVTWMDSLRSHLSPSLPLCMGSHPLSPAQGHWSFSPV